MVLSFSRSFGTAITAFLALNFLLIPNLLDQGSAVAQTFIERILKQDAQKTKKHGSHPARKRTNKRSSVKQARKPAIRTEAKARPNPVTAVPVPIPAPPSHQQDAPQEKLEEVPAPPENSGRTGEEPAASQPEPKQPALPGKDERIYQVACPVLITGEVEGKLLSPIKDGEQCGEHSPLSLSAIGKDEPLKFAHTVTTNCSMAVTLVQWSGEVNKAVRETYRSDLRIAKIDTGSDYQCRKVNSAASGRVSEHAFANALDIMSFEFSDGSKTELESGWNGSEKDKAFWRAIHAASCRLFMTVIGPDGDAAHRTNLHLDQGCHGKTCHARICQ